MSTYKIAGMTQAPTQFDNCPDFLECYLSYLSTFENRKPATVIENYTNLLEFCQYIHYLNEIHEAPSGKDAHKDMNVTAMSIGELASITQTDIEKYLCFLDTVVRNSNATLCKKLSLLRSFFRYLVNNAADLGLTLTENPAAKIKNPTVPPREAKVLSPKQVTKLLDACAGESQLRDRAIVLLFVTTGISLSQLAVLDRSDIQENELRIRSHNGTPRFLFLTPACRNALDEYILREAEPGATALFTATGSTRRLTVRNIHYRICRIAHQAGLDGMKITAQTLRDTAAATLILSGNERQKRGIVEYLGYANPDVSMKRFRSDDIKSILFESPLASLGVKEA